MQTAKAMQIERPKSLSELAAEQIRDAIVRGVFDLGSPLSEAELSKRLGISKTPIREALSALRLQGLVTVVPQRGAFVFSLSKDEIRQLCRYRYLLESNALDISIKGSPQDLSDSLTDICGEMVFAHGARDFDRYLELDAAFHDVFFLHSGNSFLHDAYRNVGDLISTLRTHLSRGPLRTEKSLAEHQCILELIQSGKLVKAKAVLKKQITRGERAYIELSGNEEIRSSNAAAGR